MCPILFEDLHLVTGTYVYQIEVDGIFLKSNKFQIVR
jgi:hypothetical protein